MDPLLLALGGVGLLYLLMNDSTPRQTVYGEVPRESEMLRLCEEAARYEGRNWKGVERYYSQAEKMAAELGLPLPAKTYELGARVAMSRGDYTTTVKRLTDGARSSPECAQKLVELQTQVVGLVSLKGRKKLVPDKPPFVPEHKLAIEGAQKTLSETGMFHGYLPKGSYMFGRKPLVVS